MNMLDLYHARMNLRLAQLEHKEIDLTTIEAIALDVAAELLSNADGLIEKAQLISLAEELSHETPKNQNTCLRV